MTHPIAQKPREFDKTFKIYNSMDGSIACQIGVIEYKVTKKDSSGNPIQAVALDGVTPLFKTQSNEPLYQIENKGKRLSLEFTNDGWKNKGIIYLQENEVDEIIRVLKGLKKRVEFKRPSKSISFEYQENNSFISFSCSNVKGSLYSKVWTYDALRIIMCCASLIQYQMKKNLDLQISTQAILDTISSYRTDTSTNINSVNTQSISTASAGYIQTPPQQANPQQINLQAGSNVCFDCQTTPNPVQAKKIIDFSTSKFWACVCYTCQQKRKGQ